MRCFARSLHFTAFQKTLRLSGIVQGQRRPSYTTPAAKIARLGSLQNVKQDENAL